MLGAPQDGQANPLVSLLPFLIIILIMYALILRPQMKRQKEHRLMLESIKKGDKILTTGGIIGTVVGIRSKDDVLIVKIADNVKVEMSRSAVAKKLE
jgi:preprotein translocase subunit YajC